MKRIKLIYNPGSGRQNLQKNIPILVEILRGEGFFVEIAATGKQLDAMDFAYQACNTNFDLIIAAGGDGTVNEVINGMMQEKHRNTKLAIYPAGTVNDFGTFLKIPKMVEDFAQMILNERSMKVDIGFSGERYFLNVAAAGLLTDVAYKVSSEAKTVLGKFAYYLEGIKEFPKQMFKPIKVGITMGENVEEREILFFIVANSASVGGFRYIAPEAKVNDGKFDLLIVEKSELKDVASIFLKVLTGKHITHPNLHYIQTDGFYIECDEDVMIDLDGEFGGRMPMTFSVVQEAIELVIP